MLLANFPGRTQAGLHIRISTAAEMVEPHDALSPGSITTTLTPCLRSASWQLRLHPRSPCLHAPYTACHTTLSFAAAAEVVCQRRADRMKECAAETLEPVAGPTAVQHDSSYAAKTATALQRPPVLAYAS